MPEMIEATGLKYMSKESERNDRLSSIYNTCLGIGQIVGPLLGSSMKKHFGFRSGTDIVSIWIAAFLIVYFFCVDGLGALKLSCRRCKGLERDRREGDNLDLDSITSKLNDQFEPSEHDEDET